MPFPFLPTIVLFNRWLLFWVFDGFLKRRITGKNGEGRPRIASRFALGDGEALQSESERERKNKKQKKGEQKNTRRETWVRLKAQDPGGRFCLFHLPRLFGLLLEPRPKEGRQGCSSEYIGKPAAAGSCRARTAQMAGGRFGAQRAFRERESRLKPIVKLEPKEPISNQ